MKAEYLNDIFWSSSGGTPVGLIWAANCNRGLVAVQVGGGEDDFCQRLSARYGKPLIFSEDQVAPVIHQIEAYLRATRKTFEIPIYWDVMSPFQQKVLQAVCAIPYGEKRTYGQIAAQLGMPQAPRAVGRANATNPVPLVIPCHRLVGADGSLRGYGGGEGVKTKAWLLDLEKRYR
jgi:methylated-DNA-[protein]-cysteine S-methyltransferase